MFEHGAIQRKVLAVRRLEFKSILLLVVIVWNADALPQSAVQSVISGKVVELTGAPARGSVVLAIPMNITDTKGVVGSRPGGWIQTDVDGNFRLSVSPGRYRIVAKDEAKGYPDPAYLLNSDSSGTFPFVSAQQSISDDVVVKLGQQGGVLTGVVRSNRGEAIRQAKITVHDAKNVGFVEFFTNENGRFLFSIPAKPVVVSVEAKGFIREEYEHGREVSLLGGETRNVVFELAPTE